MTLCRRLCALSLVVALNLSLATTRAQEADKAATKTAPPRTTRAPASAVQPVPYFTEPTLAPDRQEIAFVSGGDIWTVALAGGEARLLVSHAANESRPTYAPDGRRLAFSSNRTGGGDIYVLTLDTGELRRVTFDDSNDQLDAWSRDGRWLYFSSTSRDIAGMNDIFRVSPEGGTPMHVSADRYTNEFFSAPSPDSTVLAFTARGIASGQWWRKGRSHIDESEIWLLHNVNNAGATYNQPGTAANAPAAAAYEQITARGAKEMWPMWDRDGRSLFYVSDRGGAQNIWWQGIGQARAGTPQPITKFTDGRVLWPSISTDGRTIVFERNFRIWKLDTTNRQASEIDITRRGAPAEPVVEHLRLTDRIDEFALAPDGKKVAFVVRGEVFAASSADGGDAARITVSPADESQVTWSPDSRRLVYVSDREGTPHLYTYDFGTNTETQLTHAQQADATPRFSPDGKLLAFERGGRELRILNVETKAESVAAIGNLERPPLNPDRPFVWSPDCRWIAYMPVAAKLFRNVQVVRVDGNPGAVLPVAQPVSFLANVFSNTVSWSPDGTFMLFDTGQRTESFQVARVDLIPRTPRFREDQFRDLFREETPRNLTTPQREATPAPTPTPASIATPTPTASPTPSPGAMDASGDKRKPNEKKVEITFEGIRQRLSLLPVGLDVNYQSISPDGKWVVFVASAAGQQNLYVYSLDELAREPAVPKQLTSTPGFKGLAQFSPDSKEIFYIEQGRINVVTLEGKTRPLAVTAEMDVDFAREKMQVFRQVWSYLHEHFYDPNFHGVNWEGVRTAYEPRIAGARTPDEMRRLLHLMVGELNASHSGVSAPFTGQTAATGRLGLRFDRHEYESAGRLRVTEIIPLSPAALAREIKAGDYLVAIDGKAIDARTNLDELLNYKINRRVSLTVASGADGAGKRELAVRPVNAGTEKALLYRQWVEANRAYVTRASGGRLGYVHMFDMSSPSLAQLYVDLDAENHSREGVVVDVRNNNGGFVNVYAIDVLARRGYLTMTPRGHTSAPARTVLGQRALDAPTILLTNQHSLSDAEDFTEGYRTLKLGKVVGEPTSGWIIYTWNQTLIDGSSVRLPRMKVQAADGTNMELNPRPVDIPVSRPIGETYTGRDSQLDTAVRELLKQLGSRAGK
ncbi:MAG TPA: S41 family peptidase [Pyrinomonadaceae bacterium]|nr:S41 family peptidase [Pyrinomonadaceae bacterium]